MCGLLESGHEHSHEADGGEVADATHHLVGRCQWYLEEIPYGCLLTLGCRHLRHLLVGDIIFAHLEVFGAN